MTRQVHLVGSVPLGNAAEVFETVGSHLGTLITRIPDGETGERIQFIAFLDRAFQSAQGLERRGEWLIAGRASPLYGLTERPTGDDLGLGPLGYSEAAIASYADFVSARDSGKVLTGTRFQVSMPSPLTVSVKYAARDSFPALWRLVEQALLSELSQIVSQIPNGDLAVQWDVAAEVHTILEQPDLDVSRLVAFEAMVGSLARMIDAVPAGAEVGCHFCYGDPGHKHIVEPENMALLVKIANAALGAVSRCIDWIHMPVPAGRDDPDYFAPLTDLDIPSGTKLFLGLVHAHDGIVGATRRVAQARAVREDFGVATECGLGRRPAEAIPALLDLHREIGSTL